MIISSLEHSYTVIYHSGEEADFERFICKRENTDAVYTLLRIHRKEDIRYLLERNLLRQEINGSFVDYKEGFLWKDTLILVFLRREGCPLHQYLAEEAIVLSRRLELGKRILERLLLLNMPEYLLAAILNPDCILVTGEEEIVIRYEPEQLFILAEGGSNQLLERFYRIFFLLFQKEEQERVCPEIDVFLEQIRREPFRDVFLIYQIYDHMLEQLQGHGNIDQLRPDTCISRLRQLAAGVVKTGRRLTGPVLLVIGMAVLIYLICHPQQEETELYRFERIGTLEIDQGE